MDQKPFKYDFMRYNQYGVLRPNWPFKLSLAFLCRHIVVLVILGAMMLKRSSGTEMANILPLLDKSYIIADLPAVALVYVMGARRPHAGAGLRWIWRHGREMIFCSIALFFLITLYRNGLAFALYQPIEWMMIAGNVVVAYVAMSRYVRDLLAEFPPPPDADPG
ncbi:MAG: DUF2919 family protein [Rhodospirillales bacterium]